MRTLIAVSLLCITLRALASEPALRWHGYTFQEVDSLSSLPAALQQELGANIQGPGGIADLGKPFNEGDVVDTLLPMRRLIAAGKDGNTWLVAYEQGGVHYNVQVILFSGRTQQERCVLLAAPKTLQAVVKLLPATCPKNGG